MSDAYHGFFKPHRFPAQRGFSAPSAFNAVALSSSHKGHGYFSTVHRELAELFPWLYIQSVEFMYAKQGTTLVKTVLYDQAKMFDLLRLLEVLRTLFPASVFCTLFNMIKFVVPNQDAMSASRIAPVYARGRLPPGCMTLEMLQ